MSKRNKICSVCTKTKVLSEFDKCSKHSDGLDSRCKPCKASRMALYYKETKTVHDMRATQWRKEHPVEWAAIRRRHRRRHLREDVIKVTQRKAALASASGDHTAIEWERLKALCGYRCARCGLLEKPLPNRRLTKDHILPVALGGSNYISNIQPLCRPCNTWKGRRILDYRPTGAKEQIHV